MQTSFSLAQLTDPDIKEADAILRACVHCGFCTATCPTYVLLGDELDSPRGRIYLIKNMLENDQPATPEVVKHIDRCLSCLACMTTCPSGVHYMHLVDHGRRRIAETYDRPLADRLVRGLLAAVLPQPVLFRLALIGARFARPLAPLLPGRLAAMLRLAPSRLPGRSPVDRPQIFPAEGERVKRVALLAGCAQQVLAPQINEATIRLLTRHGCEVVVAAGAGCCGALVHHLGEEGPALAAARANIDAWQQVGDAGGLDAVVINASGCGTQIKDYGFMLRGDETHAQSAKRISGLARDVSEAARARRLHRARRARRSSLLRLGGDLQYPPARAGDAAARPQDRQYRERASGSHRDRQYRLHDPARRRHRAADRPHGRAARLGNGRSASAVSDRICGRLARRCSQTPSRSAKATARRSSVR